MAIPLWIGTLMRRASIRRSFYDTLDERMREAIVDMLVAVTEGDTHKATYVAAKHATLKALKQEVIAYEKEEASNEAFRQTQEKGGT